MEYGYKAFIGEYFFNIPPRGITKSVDGTPASFDLANGETAYIPTGKRDIEFNVKAFLPYSKNMNLLDTQAGFSSIFKVTNRLDKWIKEKQAVQFIVLRNMPSDSATRQNRTNYTVLIKSYERVEEPELYFNQGLDISLIVYKNRGVKRLSYPGGGKKAVVK
jgi:hypothetical protein